MKRIKHSWAAEGAALAVEAVEEEREGEEDEENEPDEDGGEDLDRGPSLRGWRRLRRRARWGLGCWRGGERSM